MSSLNNIHPFNMANAGQAEYAALNQHNNLIRHERLPDDLPVPDEELIQQYKNIPPYVDIKAWCAWDSGHSKVTAQGYVVLINMQENQHLAQFEITVLPEYRRHGLGRQLLAIITQIAHTDNRRLLMTSTDERIPAGEAFMLRLGAKKGLEGHTNQLSLADLDRSLLAGWLQRGQSRSTDFELGLWEGPYPEAQLPAVARLFELMNQQPLGGIEIEAVHMTPEQVRQSEQELFARGGQRWTYYIVEKKTGNFVGYTELVWNPNRPEIMRQNMTGVFPDYRNMGLGRWLKAAMLDKVLKERPQVKYVRTDNADSNAAMLKINTELGFRSYMATAMWQVEVDRVLDYLSK